jgi:gamma-glutamyltranspeptidase
VGAKPVSPRGRPAGDAARGAALDEAAGAPRFVYDGEGVHCEPGFDESVLERLEADMHVTRWTTRDAYFGTANAVALRGGELRAVGDVRREGLGIVLS